ncbi:transcription termination/antitermination NusG family protein [Pseudomonas paraeruginosa]|uniref:transcription termination/antitermination NusG family protein n=2 Tax=Pseudomonas aeruginosa group TaxID=136841 RepID=UPI0039FCFED3
MRNWYLMTHNRNALEWVTSKVEALDVELYAPTRTELRRRVDRPSQRKTTRQLFPGYLFLRFDPEVVHTTTITDIAGVQGFVRFGGAPYVISDSVIETLKETLLLRTDKGLDVVEYRNLPSEFEKSLRLIVLMQDDERRKVAFYALLQQQDLWRRLESKKQSRLCSSDKPIAEPVVRHNSLSAGFAISRRVYGNPQSENRKEDDKRLCRP